MVLEKTVTIRTCEHSRKPSWEWIQLLISNGNCILHKVGTLGDNVAL